MVEGSGAVAPLVDASLAREHLAGLRAAGVSSRRMAAAAGVSRRTVTEVVAGRRARIREDISGRLLALRGDELGLGPHGLVDAGPTLARLARLAALGYSPEWIAVALGSRAVRPRIQVGRGLVRVRTERAVAELVERVGDHPAQGEEGA